MNEFDVSIDTIPGICFYVDYDLTIKAGNAQFEKITEHVCRDVVGKKLKDLPFENLNQYFENLELLKNRDVSIVDNVSISNKNISLRFYVKEDAVLNIYCVLGIDISNDIYREVVSRSKEQENEENERFLLIGKMATQVAHEINNPLTIIAGHLSKLKRAFQKEDGASFDPVLLESVLKSQSSIERIAIIVKSLSVTGHYNFEALDFRCSVKKIIDEAVKCCSEKIIADKIVVKIYPIDDNIWIKGAEAKCVQVLQSLILNSIDALVNFEIKWISFSVKIENNLVIISIVDSGGGIPITIRDQIFRPFYTTKNKGIGVGLSNAKMILNEFYADIVYDSNSFNTKFDLYFKRA